MGQGDFNPSGWSDTAALAAMAAGRTVIGTVSVHGFTSTRALTAFDIALVLGVPPQVRSQMDQQLTEAGRATALLNAIAESMRAGPRVPTVDEWEDISGPRPRGFTPDDPDDPDLSASGVTSSFTAAVNAASAGARAQGHDIDDAAIGAIALGIAAGQGRSIYSGTLAATFGDNGPIGTTQGNISTMGQLDNAPQASAPSESLDA